MNNDYESNIKECPICYESIGDTNNCTTKCGHSFCLICILKAFQKNTTCPCCRAELNDEIVNTPINNIIRAVPRRIFYNFIEPIYNETHNIIDDYEFERTPPYIIEHHIDLSQASDEDSDNENVENIYRERYID